MNKKILVVDDEANIVKALIVILQKQGYTTFEAADGEAAMDIVEKMSPDLILLDIMIPKIDGYEVCRKVKDNPKTKHISIIMMTATRTMEESIIELECGADGCILKPFSSMDIISQVKKMLG